MIAYKTFASEIESGADLLEKQQALRNQLTNFINETVSTDEIIDICETAGLDSNLFTITVWYRQAVENIEEASDISLLPEAQSADVLARSLHEKERRAMMDTMVDEHMIRSDSS